MANQTHLMSLFIKDVQTTGKYLYTSIIIKILKMMVVSNSGEDTERLMVMYIYRVTLDKI